MSEVINYSICGSELLEAILKNGLAGFSCDSKEYPTHTSMWNIRLHLSDGRIVKLASTMHDLEGWDEVGSLLIELDQSENDVIRALPPEWRSIAKIEKLVLEEANYFRTESGICIRTADSQICVICSAAAPYEIRMKAPFFSGDFTTEYDIEQYKLEPMSQAE